MVEVAQDQAFPWLFQISVFLPNRVGSLERVVSSLEARDLSVCGFSVLDAHDHAVLRVVVDQPDKAVEILHGEDFSPVMARLIGVKLVDEQPALGTLLLRLLQAEINVHYAYALSSRCQGQGVVVLHVDNAEVAAATLRRGGFEMVQQRDLERDSD